MFVHVASHHTHITSQIIDASTDNLSNPNAIKRIALAYGNYPHTFLLILRDPIDRAFSHYMMTTRNPSVTRTFDDDIDAELRVAYTIDSTLHNVTAFERYLVLYKGFDKRGFAACFLSSCSRCCVASWCGACTTHPSRHTWTYSHVLTSALCPRTSILPSPRLH